MKNINYAILSVLIVITGFFIWQRFIKDEFNLPNGKDTPAKSLNGTVMLTEDTKHTVPLDEIMGGGPPKDGIPSIDNPKFISPKEAEEFLTDQDAGIAFSQDSIHRFYPYQILVWHEIVNDTVNGERVLVTYCPLCLSGFVFDPLVENERVEFGTSGKLWKSNLVMYDRKTDTLWSQILGKAIAGKLAGTKLSILPSDQMRFGVWKEKFPQGKVLSRDTGAARTYGNNPYDGIDYSGGGFSIGISNFSDDRLPRDTLVFGIVVEDKAKAYNLEAIKAAGEVRDEFSSETFVLRYEKDLDVVRMFKELQDGELERINPFSTFWFSWAAVHPNTQLYK